MTASLRQQAPKVIHIWKHYPLWQVYRSHCGRTERRPWLIPEPVVDLKRLCPICAGGEAGE